MENKNNNQEDSVNQHGSNITMLLNEQDGPCNSDPTPDTLSEYLCDELIKGNIDIEKDKVSEIFNNICGHHSKDHSYNLDPRTSNLECDKCCCKNFIPMNKPLSKQKNPLFDGSNNEIDMEYSEDEEQMATGDGDPKENSLEEFSERAKELLKYIKELNDVSIDKIPTFGVNELFPMIESFLSDYLKFCGEKDV